MLVMGIDPGSAITGFGIVQSEPFLTLQCITCGCIRSNPRDVFNERLKRIYDGIMDQITRFQPDQVAFEDIFYSRNIRVALQLGQARGAAILAAINAGKPVSVYAAREIKQALTGHGAATKEQVQSMVTRLLQIDLGAYPLDASDALAIAICHSHRQATKDRRC